MARRKVQEERENHERWLVSYADFITLLFAFFVVMYAVSSVNEGKYRVLSDALVAAFRSSAKALQPIQVGVAVKAPETADLHIRKSPLPVEIPKMPLPTDGSQDSDMEGRALSPADAAQQSGGDQESKNVMDGEVFRSNAEGQDDKAGNAVDRVGQRVGGGDEGLSPPSEIEKLAGEIERNLQPEIDKDLVRVRRGKLWIEVELNTSIVFGSGSAVFSGQAIPLLRALAGMLKRVANPIRVEGYTDNLPIATESFPSNWQLSAARAASVTQLLTIFGISPTRLAAVGYGEYYPIADNGTPEGRRKNRRVVIVLLANGRAAGELEESRTTSSIKPAGTQRATSEDALDAARSGPRGADLTIGNAATPGTAASTREAADDHARDSRVPSTVGPPINLRPPVIIPPVPNAGGAQDRE